MNLPEIEPSSLGNICPLLSIAIARGTVGALKIEDTLIQSYKRNNYKLWGCELLGKPLLALLLYLLCFRKSSSS
jgi:hypothetical protein